MAEKKYENTPNVGDLPADLKKLPVDLTRHWTVLDQTKDAFKKSGRSGVVIIGGPEEEYRAKVNAYLARYNTQWAFERDNFVIQHDTQARELFNEMRMAGLRVELIIDGEIQDD
jgi:hypothetical protein